MKNSPLYMNRQPLTSNSICLFDPICPVMSMELLQFYYSDCSGEVVAAFDRNHHGSLCVCVTVTPAANRAILVGSPF